MKNYSLLLASLATAALFTTPALADSTPACSTCPTCAAKLTAEPYPIKVVNPTNLPRDFVKSTINVALTVDEKGVPSEVRTLGPVDRRVAARVVSAVSQWRFSPKVVNGVPVSGRCVLPIELTGVEST
jgi:hypothetical protein